MKDNGDEKYKKSRRLAAASETISFWIIVAPSQVFIGQATFMKTWFGQWTLIQRRRTLRTPEWHDSCHHLTASNGRETLARRGKKEKKNPRFPTVVRKRKMPAGWVSAWGFLKVELMAHARTSRPAQFPMACFVCAGSACVSGVQGSNSHSHAAARPPVVPSRTHSSCQAASHPDPQSSHMASLLTKTLPASYREFNKDEE